MKFSRNWVQTFFEATLPSVQELDEKITFHSAEVEEIVAVGDDSVIDVKVLPDKSAWLLSHRGLAKELSVILDIPLTSDPLAGAVPALATLPDVRVVLDTPVCDYYSAALISGVTVGPSPAWLVARLEAIGQRSINNIVDATNYVMFELGQPLHAFDAQMFNTDSSGGREIKITRASAGSKFTTLSKEEIELTANDTVITDGVAGVVLALAGVKGGLNSGVTDATTDILLEAAHFDRVATRLTAQRHKLPTDAAKRYENGLSRSVTPYGLYAGAKLIADIAGGTVVGYAYAGDTNVERQPVSVTVADVNRVLGITISQSDVLEILNRFRYEVVQSGDVFTVTPPHERDDIVIKQDLIEEIGRIYGLSHIVSMMPKEAAVQALNVRHFYAEKIRAVLVGLGFSEIYTSSFRATDVVHIKNALASDKSYLRSSLHANIREAVTKNAPHRDLLGLPAIKVFEIGTVFGLVSESFHVGLGVQSGTAYKAKVDDALLKEAQDALTEMLGLPILWVGTTDGVTEFALDALLPQLPAVAQYTFAEKTADTMYEPFSLYPSVTRDIALWVPVSTDTDVVLKALKNIAGTLCVRITLFDTFIKDDKTSLAFRLVFQSKEKTLTASEVDEQMIAVYKACSESGWEVR
jgi:phenylalanyl-tRNA synthetase beta chain